MKSSLASAPPLKKCSTTDGSITGLGPSGRAWATGKTVLTSNVTSDPTFAPWKDRAARFGIHSSLAIYSLYNIEREAAIEKLAYYDPLTDLANRHLLLDHLEHEMAFLRRRNRFGACSISTSITSSKSTTRTDTIQETKYLATGAVTATTAVHRRPECVQSHPVYRRHRASAIQSILARFDLRGRHGHVAHEDGGQKRISFLSS